MTCVPEKSVTLVEYRSDLMLQRRGTTGSVTAVVVLEGVLSATVQVALPDSKSNSERAARQISPCTHPTR